MSRFASQPLSRCCEHTKTFITCQYSDCACSRHFSSDELEGKVICRSSEFCTGMLLQVTILNLFIIIMFRIFGVLPYLRS